MSKATPRRRLPVLVAASAVLSVSLTPAPARAQTAPPLDHFKCYVDIEVPSIAPFPGAAVKLHDQFVPAGVPGIDTHVYRAVRLCNPVKKTLSDGTSTPITDFNAHLELYTIASSVLQPNRKVVVANQFGQKRLLVTQPFFIAVPTAKNTQPPPDNLDHFQCYRATGALLRVKVNLVDQFQDAGTDHNGLRPFALCNPVEKLHGDIVTPIKNPEDHLVCYTMKPVDFTGQAAVRNQFSPGQRSIRQADILCVPSQKLKVTITP